MLTRTAAVVICLVLVVLPERTAASAGGESPAVEHSYRVIGKVRLLLFWVSADEVGGARVTWRRRGDERTLSLLIGSDPERAPRAINEWGYVLEDVRGDTATTFWIAFGVSGALAGIPVRAGYQPNWWFKVEAEKLDDHWELPPNPASQDSTRERIDSLCARPQ